VWPFYFFFFLSATPTIFGVLDFANRYYSDGYILKILQNTHHNTHHITHQTPTISGSLPTQGARWVFGGSYGGSYGGSLARFYDCNLLVYSVLYNLQLQKWWVLLRKKVKK
jgi:hypothetical protein